MGIEFRKVPGNWEHPKDDDGKYVPLKEDFKRDLNKWAAENEKWSQGLQRDTHSNEWVPLKSQDFQGKTYKEVSGPKPEPEDYMPVWTKEEKTHIQLYSNYSYGEPLSPPMATDEELAHWLSNNPPFPKQDRDIPKEQRYVDWLHNIKTEHLSVKRQLDAGKSLQEIEETKDERKAEAEKMRGKIELRQKLLANVRQGELKDTEAGRTKINSLRDKN